MPAQAERDFSLMLGGPLYQLLRRAHLSDDALALTRRRVLFIAGICWLPLLVLTGLQRQWLGGGLTVPFLLDLEVHSRFLLALPLLVVAEHIVNQRLRHIVSTFLERHLIPEEAIARFDAAYDSAMRWRNSVVAELLLIAFVYGAGTVWRHYTALNAASWYVTPSDTGSSLSYAGVWFSFVSLPAFQFLMFRWYFRMVIWMRYLWQVSRLPLSLVPLHPDRVGGLGFLANTAYAFATRRGVSARCSSSGSWPRATSRSVTARSAASKSTDVVGTTRRCGERVASTDMVAPPRVSIGCLSER
jgi:hypothetical protein